MAGARASGGGPPGKAEMVEWLFENSHELMHVADQTGRLALVNPAWCAAIGLPEDQLIGRSVLDFVHPDDVAGVRRRIANKKQGDVTDSEIRIRNAEGGWTWYAVRSQRLEGDMHIVSMRDATQARAQAEALETADRTRKLLGTAAGVGAWTYEPSENRFTWSDELLQIMGLSAEDIATPHDFRKRMPDAAFRRLLPMFERGVLHGDPGETEIRLRGERGWVRLRVHFRPEPRPDGRFALLGISQDITELAEARDAAREGERRMRQARREAQSNARRLKMALSVAEAGVYEIDHVTRTFWASPEFERITGRVGSSYEEATELRYPGFHPDDLKHVRAAFRALHHGEKASGDGFDARIVNAAGEERWIRVFHHLQVARNGRWLKAVGLVHDVDARKRQELALIEAQRAAESAAEAKAAFLANMSHEIRTPMNGIMGVLHLLKSEPLSPDGRALLEEALSCGGMLAELLNDVIDFSKIEAGRLELNLEAVDVQGVLNGVVRLLRPQADAKALGLEVDADETVRWVRADAVRLRQALFNLVGNAVKFTEQGKVTVRCFAPAAGRLRFEIEDTGVGIPLDVQDRVFRRFDQGDASTTRRFGGSGLGLAITKRLAEIMGGDVGFTSAPGQGSTFWFEIAAEAAQPATRAADTGDGLLDGIRVLVVEDNPTNRLIATKLLEQLGASVETAADGYVGVEAASRGGFDLILMDVQMPGIDGPEAARRIRALGGPAAETPIIALTANVLAHQRQAYLDAGMDGVVAKPISPAALLGEIAKLGAAASEASAESPVARAG